MSITTIFETVGFIIVWLNQGVEKVKLFMSVSKQILNDNHFQIWNADLQDFKS